MIDLDCCHTCRDPPFEAAMYNLEAKGKMMEIFRADVNVELTVELEEQDKTECSSMTLSLDFSKEDVAMVIRIVLYQIYLTDIAIDDIPSKLEV